MMEKEKRTDAPLKKIRALHQRRRQLMVLEPENALEQILESDNPAALVHSFSEQDFHLLVHDIGPEDALPLLSLASEKQWEYVVDAEVWNRDRLEMAAITRWLDLLHRSDPARMLRWLVQNKLELLEFYLFKNIEVRIREHDQDPSDFGKDWFSVDNHFYLRSISDPFLELSDLSEVDKQRYRRFLEKLIHGLAAADHITYQKILLEAVHIIPTESEEEAYRQRNVRMAEKGFLPFEEAVGVYQPLTVQQLTGAVGRRPRRPSSGDPTRSVTLYPVQLLKEKTDFARALARLDADAAIEGAQSEFAGLCNRIIAADCRKVKSREDLQQIVRKACGYLSIGLHALTDRPAAQPLAKEALSAELIRQHRLEDIFRVGYGQALKLKWRAQQWLNQAWFASKGLSLTFWGEAWLGVLGGVLVKKPLYFDNYRSATLYRDFESPEEIRQADAVLNEIIAVDELLSLSQIDPQPLASYRFLTYKNFLLTLWVRDHLGLSGPPAPLPLEAFRQFYQQLWIPDSHPGQIRQRMREAFLQWLAVQSGRREDLISANLAATLERLFLELEDEYGPVAAKDLDPRFIQHFLIER
jgi:hypothetical protein